MIEEILANIPDNYEYSIIFLADETTFKSKENTLLCIDVESKGKNQLRVIPTMVYNIENNLSISNMDFEEFLEECDEGGVFRGFEN